MTQWLKNMIGSLCLLTILLHLIPKGKYAKYVRFYAGLLFFLVASGPLLQILGGEGELERLLQLEFVKNEYYDLESAAEGMAELKNERIREAYDRELRRQISGIAEAYGFAVETVCLNFDPKDGYTLTGVSIYLKEGEYSDDAAKQMQNEIASVYLIDLNRITVRQG